MANTQYFDKKEEIEIEYEKRNQMTINKLLSKDITIRECLRELNKNLGFVLVKLSEIK